MNGGKNKKPHGLGYTIVEVMIFLAVSGFMFLTAAVFINGKQASAEFHQSTNDANTQMRGVINDVINGFYPSQQNFECKVAGSTLPPTLDTFSTNAQGANTDCIFMGKVIQFDVKNAAGQHDGTHYNVYTIAGRHYAKGSTTQPPQNLTDAMPVPVDNSDSTNTVNITDKKTFQWGLYVTKVVCIAPSSCAGSNVGAIGIFGDFGNYASGVLQSGSMVGVVVNIANANLAMREQDILPVIRTTSNLQVVTNPNILICFNDGKGKRASVTIGGQNGQQLTTSLKTGGVNSQCP